MPIRNAPTPSSDGTLSTAGPCGGVLNWGNKSYTTVTPGQNVSLVFAYNGGHQSPTLNMLRVAMICGKPMSDVLLKNTTVAPVFSPLVNASASSTLGYDLWVIIPQIQNGMNGQYCTISALDVRNWGGCVDVEIVSAKTPTPATNALTGINLAGTYTFGQAQCKVDSPACCCVNGTLTVTHATGATTATASATLNACANSNGTTDVLSLTLPVTLNQEAANLASLKGTITPLSKTVTFQTTATPGAANSLVMTDDSAVPYFCGFETNVVSGGKPPSPGPSENSASTLGLFTSVAAVFLAALFY